MYLYKNWEWIKQYSLDFSADEKIKILWVLNKAIDDLQLRPTQTWWELVEDRGTQITYSALGQQAPLEAKHVWDPDFEVRKKIRAEADIKAAGYIRGGDTASTRALINSTLGMGPGYYDKKFKGIIDPEMQKAELARLLEENAFKSFTNGYKTTVEDGKTVYWSGEGKPRLVPNQTTKATKVGGKAAGGATATQKNQGDFNTRIKDVISSGQGGITKGGYTLSKDGTGVWQLLDKDGLPKEGTEKIHDPYILQKYIGGTLKKPLRG